MNIHTTSTTMKDKHYYVICINAILADTVIQIHTELYSSLQVRGTTGEENKYKQLLFIFL